MSYESEMKSLREEKSSEGWKYSKNTKAKHLLAFWTIATKRRSF